ncbi:vacuolar protein sorting-associated protein 72 homolog [Oppia nitens]|uniref:vacuolar protein sorting-associated protein 72 homolog n=1 Tax=Oppia nitens TaxID=1686743 RepID=UPI0023D9A17D|nr:vacuolar protein sorting-associated protein 72 homolog [Oppia nitens]
MSSSASDGSESDGEPIVTLAAGRVRRPKAGANMSRLLDSEEAVDDFYKTTYGGFEEEVEDNDYTSDGSDSHDEIDSDFSIDENDEPVSDGDDEDNRKRRRSKPAKRGAYREPKPAAAAAPVIKKPTPIVKVKTETPAAEASSSRRSMATVSGTSPTKNRLTPKKSFRESTRRNARETEQRLRIARKETEMRRKAGVNKVPEYRQLTQQEMFREAKKTEQLNLKSLERYRKLELEKSKKIKLVKEAPKGPMIRYQSVTMPLIEVISSETFDKNSDNNDMDVDNDTNDTTDNSMAAAVVAADDDNGGIVGDDDDDDSQVSTTINGDKQQQKTLTPEPVVVVDTDAKCSRTFISFTDDKTYADYFSGHRRRPPQVKPKLYCPISHLPGRYFDPVTLLPYSSAATFRAIREAYYKQLEQLGDQRQPEVAKWIQWRKRTAAQRNNIQPRIIRIIK